MDELNRVSLVLTRDNFLDVLLKRGDRWSPNAVRQALQTRDAIDPLFIGVLEYIGEQGYADLPDRQSGLSAAGQLPLMLRKTVHVNVSRLILNDIREFIGLFTILLSLALKHYGYDYTALVALIPLLLGLIRKLKKVLGEVCVVECIQEHYVRRLQIGATAASIAHELQNEPCRYPGQGCRFEKTEVCTMNTENVEAALADLEKKEVVAPISSQKPPEWKVIF